MYQGQDKSIFHEMDESTGNCYLPICCSAPKSNTDELNKSTGGSANQNFYGKTFLVMRIA